MAGDGAARVMVLMAAASTLLATSCSLGGDPIQKQWESRDAYPTCGDVTLGQGEQFEERAAEEIGCLRQALQEGEGAELSVSFPTVEGDTIRTHYRLTPQGALELYEDNTEDAFGDQKWSFTECYRPDWLPEVSCT